MNWKIIGIILNIIYYLVVVALGVEILNKFYDLCKNVKEIKKKLEIE